MGRFDEARRSARVTAGFLVAIDGIDSELVPRYGDISATGIFFESEVPLTVGTVQWLHVASSNRARAVRLMAHVVRSLTLDNVGGHSLHGVAFEFMPESNEAAAAVESFVQYMLFPDEPFPATHVSSRLRAHAEGVSSDTSAVVRQLSVRSMTLEASWNVQPGEHIRVDIAAPGMSRRLRLREAPFA